jgi:transposase
MKQTSGPAKPPAQAALKEIRRATRRQFSAEEKIRIVLEGLRGEDSIAELCRREASPRRCTTAGPRSSWKPARSARRRHGAAATSDEVKELRREASALKEVVADLTLENRLLKKA